MAGGDAREATISMPVYLSEPIVLERFDVMERLSELFVIHAQIVCVEVVDFYLHLGEPVKITVKDDTGSPARYFHGLLFEADYVDQTTAGFRYQITLRPWLYILSRNIDYHINQDKSAIDIVKALFESRHQSDIDYTKLSGTTAPRHYCVQYRESDFQFFSRLMEEEGIYYFFRHTEDKHELVLCNARSSHEAAECSPIPFIPPTGGAQSWSSRITVWNERVGSTGEQKVKLRNFDFERPATPREGVFAEGVHIPAEAAEIYDFPAVFMEPDEGAKLGQTIMEAARRDGRTFLGEGDAVSLACGDLLALEDHSLDRYNQDYLVVGLRYSVESQSYRSGGGGGSSGVSIEAVPADVSWRAPIRTPKPIARGPETAVVTGPDGEIIYTDEYGRVKVRFHWEHGSPDPDKTSCFIRVSHSSADSGFGHLVLPRLGQEVIVDYLNGDPDRPMITGRVYNKDHMQAEGLPGQKTRSTWRSRTIGQIGSYDGAEKGAPAEPGFNLLGFEDKGGEEALAIWAQRNRFVHIWLDDDWWANRDELHRVGRDRKTEIKRNETKTVEDGDETHTVKSGKRTTSIKMDETLTVTDGNMLTTVSKGNQSTKISMGNQENEVSQGNQTNKVSMGNKSTKVEMGNYTVDVAMGNFSLKTDLGKIEMEALQSIELKVMGNSIKIDPTGVSINGIIVKIEGQAMLQATAPMTQINGDAMTTVKGAVVMIN